MSPGESAASGSGRDGGGLRAGQPVRRTFTSAYKLKIVDEYYSLTEHGARGALLLREGLYQSHVEKWRRARDRGALDSSRKSSTAASGKSGAVVRWSRRIGGCVRRTRG